MVDCDQPYDAAEEVNIRHTKPYRWLWDIDTVAVRCMVDCDQLYDAAEEANIRHEAIEDANNFAEVRVVWSSHIP